MNQGKISIRYARALYALAEEKQLHHEVYQKMVMLSQMFFMEPKLAAALANPMYSSADKEKLLVSISDVKESDLFYQFIQFVVKKERESYFLFIAMSYQDIYRKEQHIVVGKIVSASQLDKSSMNRIKDLLSKLYASEVKLSEEVSEDLIGGFLIEVNNCRFDASVRTRLRSICDQLTIG